MDRHKPVIHNQEVLTPHYARYRALLCQQNGLLDHRLRAGRMEQLSFSALRQRYDLLLLDAFGVLNRGPEPIPGAVESVARLGKTGQPFLLLSNNASQSPERLQGELSRMGFSIRPSEICTSGMAVRPFVADSPFQGLPYYLVGTPDSAAAYAPDPANLCLNHQPGEAWRAARYILLCSNRDYYGTRQQQQVEHDALRARR